MIEREESTYWTFLAARTPLAERATRSPSSENLISVELCWDRTETIEEDNSNPDGEDDKSPTEKESKQVGRGRETEYPVYV